VGGLELCTAQQKPLQIAKRKLNLVCYQKF
jgi:hypothetical protein